MLEERWQDLDHRLGLVETTLRSASASAKTATGAARAGDLARVRRAVGALEESLDQARELLASLEAARQSLEADLASGLDELQQEVVARVQEAGWPWQRTERSSDFVSYPVVISFGNDAVKINRKSFRGRRPSAIVAQIGRARVREVPGIDQALRAVFRAVLLLNGHKSGRPPLDGRELTASTADIYEVLSLNNPAYTVLDFVRHLYEFDQRRTNVVNGYLLDLHDSTGTRGRTRFLIYGEDGQEHTYSAVTFRRQQDV